MPCFPCSSAARSADVAGAAHGHEQEFYAAIARNPHYPVDKLGRRRHFLRLARRAAAD